MIPGLEKVAALLRPVPDFPKPGILFWDIEPLLRDPEARSVCIGAFSNYWSDKEVDAIAGFDVRGFIFGSLLAARMRLPFVQIRKKGKLPGKTVSQTYDLEYGTAEVEMIDDGFIAGKRVLLVDDLLATGGTALAGAKLVEQLDGTVAGFTCVTELPELAGRSNLMHYPVHSLISILEGKAYAGVDHCVDILTYDGKTSDLILVRRLNNPTGLAMPGGHIEHESLLAAGQRELEEETGCVAIPGAHLFHSVLTKPDRDPRGLKVSHVLVIMADTTNARGETGKTEIVRFTTEMGLPDRSLLVLGHGDAVHAVSDIQKSFGLT